MSCRFGGFGEGLEVLDRAEVGVHGLVAAGLVADRPGGAGVLRSGGEGVVGALAVGQADRVDRRQVEDVEAELGEPRELVLRRRCSPPQERGNSSYQLPNRRPQPVDFDGDGLREGDAAVAGLDPLDGGEQLGAERDVVLGRLGNLGVAERGHGVLDQRLVALVGGGLLRRLEQQDALGELAGEVMLLRGDLALELVAPGAEHVGPRLHRELPAALAVDVEAAGPAHAAEVGVDPLHLGLPAVVVAGALVADDGAEQVVAVAEDVGLHRYGVSHAALGGVQSAVDGRGRVLDDDALGRLGLAARATRRGARRGFSGRRGHGRSRWTDGWGLVRGADGSGAGVAYRTGGGWCGVPDGSGAGAGYRTGLGLVWVRTGAGWCGVPDGSKPGPAWGVVRSQNIRLCDG